jgi:aryl-alcohol dehydrogenase-like predicted oxidoreductase
VHDIADLSKEGSNHLLSWLLSLKERRLVENIGVSVYESTELDAIDLGMVDVIQLPYSIYDQRMSENGTLEMLRHNNIKVHARSVFLQGLLLTQPDSWPNWIPQHERDHHRAFVSAVKSCNLTLLQAALYFAFSQTLVDYIVVGFCTLLQVKETVRILRSFGNDTLLPSGDWTLSSSSILLDPRRWPSVNQ